MLDAMASPVPVIRGERPMPLPWLVVGLAAVNTLFVLWAVFVALAAPQVREREVPLELTAVSDGTSFVRLSAREVIVRVDAAGGIRAGGTAATVDVLQRLLSRLSAQGGGVSGRKGGAAAAFQGLGIPAQLEDLGASE